MCFKVVKYLVEVDLVLAPSNLHLFVLDVVQNSDRIPLQLHALMSGMPRNFKEHVILKHDLCDDDG